MSCRSHFKGAAAFLLLAFWISAYATDKNVLIVDLRINHQQAGDSFVLQDENGDFLIDETVLLEWEVARPWPQATVFRGDRYYRITDLAGASGTLDTRTMRLDVEIPASLMPQRTVDMSTSDLPPKAESFGLYMDYQLNWLNYQQEDLKTTNAFLQPVVFGDFGSISANALYRSHSGPITSLDSDPQSGFKVLELTYTRDDPENLRSLRIGDLFTNPGTQGRAIRMAGVQLATNFATQPELITFPLPSFFGEASVPTALDVYVNGQLRRTENVEPGSYVLNDVPVINGAGQIQVVARDALGRQQVFTQDFYSSTELLREGLHDYSVSIGALREEYGLENFRYGDFAASGSWRYGRRDDLTIETHGEFTSGLGMMSGGFRYVIPAGGTFNAGLGLSRSGHGTGGIWQLGFRQHIDVLSYGLRISGTSSRFRLVGNPEPPPKLQVVGTVGKNFFERGSVGLSAVHQEFHARPKRTIVTANHTISFRNSLRMTSHLSIIDAATNDVSVGIRFSMPFGDRHYATAGASASRHQNRLDAEISKALPLGNGLGYRLGVSALDDRYVDAGASLRAETGTYTLDVRTSEDSGSVWQAGTSGSVAYLSGMTKFTREIRDAFAVVNVGEFEGVRVYAENIEIGRTNKNGKLFVPGLQPYLRNSLRIEIDDLPMNARIESIETEAAPYYRSGVVVNFDVAISNNVLLRAVLPDGTPVPEGAYATINRLKKLHPVGRDGKLYLQGIDRSSLITLRWNGSTCELDVPFPDSTAVIAKLGEIVCDPRKAK